MELDRRLDSAAIDEVEAALSYALRKATDAGEWSLVAQLAAQVAARRQERLGVIDLAAERAKRRPPP